MTIIRMIMNMMIIMTMIMSVMTIMAMIVMVLFLRLRLVKMRDFNEAKPTAEVVQLHLDSVNHFLLHFSSRQLLSHCIGDLWMNLVFSPEKRKLIISVKWLFVAAGS